MPIFVRLVEYYSAEEKEHNLIDANNRIQFQQQQFGKIPGSPIAYWVSENFIKSFIDNPTIGSIGDAKHGMSTGNNGKFLRIWSEVNLSSIGFSCDSRDFAANSGKKWFPYNKGGEYRRWYGNNNYVVNYLNGGQDMLDGFNDGSNTGFRHDNKNLYFLRCATWSFISSSNFGVRRSLNGFIFDVAGSSAFFPDDLLDYAVAFLCSKVACYILSVLNPTLNFQVNNIASLPLSIGSEKNKVCSYACECVQIVKADWDIHENSWDYLRSPLITNYAAESVRTRIEDNLWDISWPSLTIGKDEINLAVQSKSFQHHWLNLFMKLCRNEEALNRIFIQQYGLHDEISPDVSFIEVTILQEELVYAARKEEQLKFDEASISSQFVSYGVGCLLGRFSVEKDGLILADQISSTVEDFFSVIPNAQYLPDLDGILPLTDEDDFSDDLPSAFKSWLRFISGDHYDGNLHWIEDTLGKDLRTYFNRDFYKDHIKRYKSRPIYWMVSSPSGAFRALIYLHRYSKDTVGKILNDYVRPYRTKLDQKIRGLESVIDSGSSSAGEKTKAKKRLAQLEKYKTEIEAWEKEKLYPLALKRVELDLDDGVKVNYRKLDGILEPVKQLEAKEEED